MHMRINFYGLQTFGGLRWMDHCIVIMALWMEHWITIKFNTSLILCVAQAIPTHMLSAIRLGPQTNACKYLVWIETCSYTSVYLHIIIVKLINMELQHLGDNMIDPSGPSAVFPSKLPGFMRWTWHGGINHGVRIRSHAEERGSIRVYTQECYGNPAYITYI